MSFNIISLGIVGCGATTLFFLRHMLDLKECTIRLIIFERDENEDCLGVGMPYHPKYNDNTLLANVTSMEIPELGGPSLNAWLLEQSDDWLNAHHLKREDLLHPIADRHMICTRVIMGKYFHSRFVAMVEEARALGIDVQIHLGTSVTDLEDVPEEQVIKITTKKGETETIYKVDKVLIATGHRFSSSVPAEYHGLYQSTIWPTHKLKSLDYPTGQIGILGSSLTTVDAVMTLAHHFGTFHSVSTRDAMHSTETLCYKLSSTLNLSIKMFSRHGFLPYLRFRYADPELEMYRYMTHEDIQQYRDTHDTALHLDFFYAHFIQQMGLVDPSYVTTVLDHCPTFESYIEYIINDTKAHGRSIFDWLAEELSLAEHSIATNTPLYWREVLLNVIYTMTFYTALLSMEDKERFRQNVYPIFMYIAAFMPLESAQKLLALHHAGVLTVHSIGSEYALEVNEAKTGINIVSPTLLTLFGVDILLDARAQRSCRVLLEDYPFPTLVKQGMVSQHQRGGVAVDGVAVNHAFQVLNTHRNTANDRVYDLSNAHICGATTMIPFYEGLGFCYHTSKMVLEQITERMDYSHFV